MIILLIACNSVDKAAKTSNKSLRIISTAPSITELLYFLDADDMLIGVSDYCKFPPSVEYKTKIGGLLNPNTEQVLNLSPDLIIVLPSGLPKFTHLRKMGIKLLVVKNETVEEILQSITTIGLAIGREEESLKLVHKLGKIHALKPSGRLIKALIVVSRQKGALKEIYVAGKQTYLSQFVENAGFKNIFSNLSSHYSTVNIEAIIKNDPEVIFETEMSSGDSLVVQKKVGDWAILKGIAAVRNKRIYKLSAPFIHVPAVRIFTLQNTFTEIRKEWR